jgi:hypothetical protein
MSKIFSFFWGTNGKQIHCKGRKNLHPYPQSFSKNQIPLFKKKKKEKTDKL